MKSITFAFFALFMCLFISCGSTKTVVNGLDEKDANEILVFLSSKGIEAQKMPSTEGSGAGQKMSLWDISVDEKDAREAMSLLNQVGLPRRRGQNLLDIFQNNGLVPSELQDKIRYQAGLAAQIASTIRKIDGVLDAEVQISFPEEDPLNPNASKGKITASVYVKHSGVLDDPNSHLMTKIKRLVTASVTGLDFDNVTVIPDRARFSEINPGTIQGSFDEDKQYVNIWGIVLSKESVTKFRIIFFTFVFLLLSMLLTLVWLLWKVLPLLKQYGGFKELLHFHPIGKEAKAKDKDENEADVKEDKDKAADKASSDKKSKDKIKEGQKAISQASDDAEEVEEVLEDDDDENF